MVCSCSDTVAMFLFLSPSLYPLVNKISLSSKRKHDSIGCESPDFPLGGQVRAPMIRDFKNREFSLFFFQCFWVIIAIGYSEKRHITTQSLIRASYIKSIASSVFRYPQSCKFIHLSLVRASSISATSCLLLLQDPKKNLKLYRSSPGISASVSFPPP